MFYPETIKNDHGAVAMRKFVMQRELKQHLNQLKKDDVRV